MPERLIGRGKPTHGAVANGIIALMSSSTAMAFTSQVSRLILTEAWLMTLVSGPDPEMEVVPCLIPHLGWVIRATKLRQCNAVLTCGMLLTQRCQLTATSVMPLSQVCENSRRNTV